MITRTVEEQSVIDRLQDGLFGDFSIVGLRPPSQDLLGSRICITGAAGSIGGALARRLVRAGAGRLSLIDSNAGGLEHLSAALVGMTPSRIDIDCYPVDICDVRGLSSVFGNARPEVVVHAAAIKHLPDVELDPARALGTNVGGTINVANACKASDVPTTLHVSTDKASVPTSVLGASKLLAERVCASVVGTCGAPGAVATSVRFCNVLASAGSVVDAFLEQRRRGGLMRLSNPEALRRFVTLQQAADLVIDGLERRLNQRTLAFSGGLELTVGELAARFRDVAGTSCPIDVIGLSPGEKLREDLVAPSERIHDVIEGLYSVVITPLIDVDRAAALADEGDLVALWDMLAL